MNNLTLYIILYGSFLAITMAVGQLVEKKRYTESYLLIILYISAAIWQFYNGVITNDIHILYPHLQLIQVPFLYITIPLIYFLFKSLSRVDYTISKKQLLHFFPAFVIVALLIPFYFQSAEFKRAISMEPPSFDAGSPFNLLYSIILVIIMISGIIYIVVFLTQSDYLYNKKYLHANKITYFTFIILVFSALIILTYFIGMIIYNVFHLDDTFYFQIIKLIGLMTTAVVIVIYLMGKRYPYYFLLLNEEKNEMRYAKSKIESLNIPEILKKLHSLMEEEELYKDETLSIKSLSEKLAIEPYQLSEVLNARLNKNFNTYINEYRVEEAKRLLLEDISQSVTSISYSVGFNSASSFYDWFMKMSGYTPTKYRNKHYKKMKR
ncbi:MAG: helix-turn-helix domain-containing protein [Spirochaetota bacterium]